MIYPPHLLAEVIDPVLQHLGLYSVSASRLVLGTALCESRASYLRQHPTGPALGIYQIEPATFRWLWWEWLPTKRPGLRDRIAEFIGPWRATVPPEIELISNLCFSTALCRVRYLAVPEALPDASDIEGLARYWKRHYNTPAGKGKIEDWVKAYTSSVVSKTINERAGPHGP